jgi:SEC-C motif-containing protein
MRSRYSAYVLKLASYVQATWHASTRPAELELEDQQTKWLGLDINGHSQQGDTATVEFVARYKVGGRAHRLHEISRFVREDGRWYYLDGELLPK